LIADPYYEKLQVAIFQSNGSINDDLYFKNEDVIIKTALTSTMTMRRDKDYKIFLWTQYPSNLSSIPVLKYDEE